MPSVAAPQSRALRVLQVVDSLARGGKERQLVELLGGLERAGGIECELVVMSPRVAFAELARLRAPVRVLERKHRYDLSMFRRLLAVARAMKPDVIHSWNSMCSIFAAPVAGLVGAKFVNGFVRDARPGLTLADRDYFRGRLLMPFSDVVVANSAAGLSAYAVPAHKGVCIHNGFDARRIEGLPSPETVRRALGIETPFVVGMVASFSDLKDYDVYLEAARRLAALRDDTTFLAVGDGPDLERLRRTVPADRYARIRFLGARDDVEALIGAFTLGVLTSRRGEGISNAIMEYMAMGKPVVATQCAGNAELVEDGRTGKLVPAGDADATAGAISGLLDDPARAAALGASGRERLNRLFGLERMTAAYVELYKSCIKTAP